MNKKIMVKLDTIQVENNLNEVYRFGSGYDYDIYRVGGKEKNEEPLSCIHFQMGARETDPRWIEDGVLDNDLLEIVRDRLRAFQSGELANFETQWALTHVEEALKWLAKRTEDRAKRHVLGTMEK